MHIPKITQIVAGLKSMVLRLYTMLKLLFSRQLSKNCSRWWTRLSHWCYKSYSLSEESMLWTTAAGVMIWNALLSFLPWCWTIASWRKSEGTFSSGGRSLFGVVQLPLTNIWHVYWQTWTYILACVVWGTDTSLESCPEITAVSGYQTCLTSLCLQTELTWNLPRWNSIHKH